MADPFLGEVRMFAGNFPPSGWAYCDGAILPISQNTALFSLLGTLYGGNGTSTFALPNLQGSVALHAGASAGPGLSPRNVGETGGAAGVALTTAQIPSHMHTLEGVPGASTGTPGNTVSLAPSSNGTPMYRAPDTVFLNMNPATAGVTGGGGAHNNLSPYLSLSFIIALQGIYPPRS